MAADGTGRAPGTRQPPGIATPRARLRWLLVVVTVMALLTAGWPLLNSAVADKKPLAAGSALRIGPAGTDSAEITVGPDWSLLPAESNASQRYILRRGAATVSISYLSLVSRFQAPRLWDGMREMLGITHPGASLGAPSVITSSQGRTGMTGAVTSRRHVGAVTLFVGPSGTFAIAMIVLAPRNGRGAAMVAAVRMYARSLRFPAAPR